MIFWMRHPPHAVEGELAGRMAKVVRLGPLAALAIAFFAVLREGIEATTVVFVTGREANAGFVLPMAGLLLGVAIAVLLSLLLRRGTIRVNMGTFFTVTGLLLVFVAAGMVSEGLNLLQEANILPGAQSIAFDITPILPDHAWWSAVVLGIVNISTRPTVLQAITWAVYWLVVTTLFMRALPRPYPMSAATAVPKAN
jgi:high-affinity iron transporter